MFSVFVYGTLQTGHPNHYLLGNALAKGNESDFSHDDEAAEFKGQ